MRALALDIGEVRVGIAASDASGTLASPVQVLPFQEVVQVARSFRYILEDYEPDVLVCGRPKTMQGEDGPQAERIEQIAIELAAKLQLPLEFQDERLSSSEAKRILREQGLNEKQMRGKIDSVAASLFLQTWLDAQKEDQLIMQHMNNDKTPRRKSSAPKRQPRFKTQPFEDEIKLKPKRKIITWIVVLIIAVVALNLAYPHISTWFSGHTVASSEDKVKVTFADGSSASQFAEKLYEAGLISSQSDFLSEVKAQNAAQKLKPGTYMLNGGMNVSELVKILCEGPGAFAVKLSIPEGFTVDKTAKRVQEVYGISADEFKSKCKASLYVAEYPFLKEAHNDSLEGFLYPKTYTFSSDKPTSEEIIRAMLNQYQKEVTTLDFAAASARVKKDYGVDMNQYDFLILASIIEREATTPEQQGLISSVFYNRMKQGMPLQSDATMMYVTGGEVTAADLKIQSPYNSYLNKGLTPTPICSPSLACIKAAMNPDKTDYLYFFINDKVTQFSVTYEDHNKAIEKSLKG